MCCDMSLLEGIQWAFCVSSHLMMEEVDNIMKMTEFVCLAGSRTLCLIMEESSSSRNKLASEDIAVCRRCNCEHVQKVSHSSQNPGRLYFKYLRCDKFLKWAANEGPQERPVIVDVDIVKKELMEMRLMLKFIEKGQTLIVVLLIVVIVLIAMVVVM
ncbi:hypothetical protein Cgig2_005491 [Carnegiea gigantea]|uniref:Uncharacterized protein n=1 Tax=Carnegiea gigantea TaxID=171969 RepID=A0A9Q1QHP6_9CARY|nr:hypothetical protein Cgig2_005491 [Carnegiea gigantea]